jgi:hypothetical protein
MVLPNMPQDHISNQDRGHDPRPLPVVSHFAITTTPIETSEDPKRHLLEEISMEENAPFPQFRAPEVHPARFRPLALELVALGIPFATGHRWVEVATVILQK